MEERSNVVRGCVGRCSAASTGTAMESKATRRQGREDAGMGSSHGLMLKPQNTSSANI